MEPKEAFLEKFALEEFCRLNSSSLPPFFEGQKNGGPLQGPPMEVGPWIAVFLQVLVRACGAKRILEIGTYGGYSTLALAQALPPGGALRTIDKDPRALEVARAFVKLHCPLDVEVSYQQQDGIEALAAMKDGFCLIFIDADKNRSLSYWQNAKPLLRKGGLIVFDNVLLKGATLDPANPKGEAMRELLNAVRQDSEFLSVVLPLRDGLLLSCRQ